MALLPQFPLKLVVFPGEMLNLHIFEDRYIQLVEDCQKDNLLFGIPSLTSDQKFRFGTSVAIETIAKTYPDGSMDIKTRGNKVYRIESFTNPMSDRLYAGAIVNYIDQYDDSIADLNKTIIHKVNELYGILGIEKTGELNPQTFRTFHLAHKIGLSYSQEMDLRQLSYESEKQVFILEHFEKLIPVVSEIEEMKKKIRMNGHFKNLESYDL